MKNIQSGILEPVPAAGCYLYFGILPGANVENGLRELRSIVDGKTAIVGLGNSLLSTVNRKIDSLPAFPPLSENGIDVPSTPASLWVWLRGEDRGELLHRSRDISATLSKYFYLQHSIDAFRYGSGLDLTGYEDGTENPQGDDAITAAFVNDGSELDGSSFVAVQKWQHNLDVFNAMSQEQRDHTIGRRISDNEELDDAPESAHVKRTAQESFSPEAFMLRRSMPWADACVNGLVFVAFANSVYPFSAQMNRMVGAEDGSVDALFRFSRPVSGSFFWCPAMKSGELDLSILLD